MIYSALHIYFNYDLNSDLCENYSYTQAFLLALHKLKISEEQRKSAIDCCEPLVAFALSYGMYSSPAVSSTDLFICYWLILLASHTLPGKLLLATQFSSLICLAPRSLWVPCMHHLFSIFSFHWSNAWSHVKVVDVSTLLALLDVTRSVLRPDGYNFESPMFWRVWFKVAEIKA